LKPFTYRSVLSVIGLSIALGAASWPYGYYPALRLVATVGAIILLVRVYNTKKWVWSPVAIGILLLFPAYMNVELPKSTWIFVDLIFGGGLVFAAQSLGVPVLKRDLGEDEAEEYKAAVLENIQANEHSGWEKDPNFDAKWERRHLELDDGDRLKVTLVAIGSVVLAFLVFGSIVSGSPSGCTEYVSDSRGGSCESY